MLNNLNVTKQTSFNNKTCILISCKSLIQMEWNVSEGAEWRVWKQSGGVNPGQSECCESVIEVHISWLLRAVTAAGQGAWERGRKEGEQGGRVVIDEGKWVKGRAMAGKEEGGVEVCTRLSAPGVPFGPGSNVREGWRGGRRKRMERRRRMRRGRGQGPCLHLKLSNEIYNKKWGKDWIKFLMRHFLPLPPLRL